MKRGRSHVEDKRRSHREEARSGVHGRPSCDGILPVRLSSTQPPWNPAFRRVFATAPWCLHHRNHTSRS